MNHESNRKFLLEKFSEPVQKSMKTVKIDAMASSISNSKGTKEMIDSIIEFFNESNLGVCEFDQRAGRNILKIQKIKGINHAQLVKFFEIIFADCLKNYQSTHLKTLQYIKNDAILTNTR